MQEEQDYNYKSDFKPTMILWTLNFSRCSTSTFVHVFHLALTHVASMHVHQ